MARIALIGDSQLTDTSSRDVTKLGPRLRRRGHEVITLAVGGMNTRVALEAANDVEDAEWTVYCLGANDSATWKRVPPEEFAANYDALLLRATSGRQLVLGPGHVVESGLPLERTNCDLKLYSTIAANVAARHGAVFVSLCEALDAGHLAEDGVHLNDDGYGVLERLVVETIDHRP